MNEQVSGPRPRAADDFAEIGKHFELLRDNKARVCRLDKHGTAIGCWCLGAAEDGSNMPCPQKVKKDEAAATVHDYC